MRQVYLIASKSKDTRTKIGAVLVKNKRVIQQGYNGMPGGVNDDVPGRYSKPEKYYFFAHAEANSIFGCAKFGISSEGATCYTQGLPCANCTIALLQGGITELVVHKQWEDLPLWKEHSIWQENAARSKIMLAESDVTVYYFDMILGIQGLCDGKVVNV